MKNAFLCVLKLSLVIALWAVVFAAALTFGCAGARGSEIDWAAWPATAKGCPCECPCALGLPCPCGDACQCPDCPGRAKKAAWQPWHNGWWKGKDGSWWHAQHGSWPAGTTWGVSAYQPVFPPLQAFRPMPAFGGFGGGGC